MANLMLMTLIYHCLKNQDCRMYQSWLPESALRIHQKQKLADFAFL